MERISIDISKDENKKYTVSLLNSNKVVAKDDIKNIKITIENEDRSYREVISNIDIDTVGYYENEIICNCRYYCKMLETYIDIQVVYKVVNEALVEKRIILKQTNIPMLFYSIENSIIPSEEPKCYWSFDNDNNNGGVVREVFPAAGYVVGKAYVGLLTDAGHRNYWTRNIRRRPHYNKLGFTAIKEACDINLYRVSTLSDREKGDHYVKITLGELIDFNNGKKEVVEVDNDFINKDDEGSLIITLDLEDGYYDISFDHRINGELSVVVLKELTKDNYEVHGFDYQNNIPSYKETWTSFQDGLILSNTENKKSLLVIKSNDNESIDIKNLKVTKVNGIEKPFHRLEQGKSCEKKLFILIKQMDGLRDIRYYSQVLLADGLGFNGSDVEKILFADMQMLTWITSAYDFLPLNVPSLNYAPDMYNRDSFWSVAGVNDKELSKKLWEKWGSTQNENGTIGTIITPYMGSLEVKGNEATCEWIWWAYINKIKYGIEPNMSKVKKAYNYCINEFDEDGDGIAKSHFVLGQNDVQTYFEGGKTSSVSVNQGVFAVTLKVAKALGIDVPDDYIEKANIGYKSFYSNEKGYLLNTLDYKDAISVGDLMPEFVSLWFFNEGLLNEGIVKNTLEKIPVINDCATFIGHVNNKYFSGVDSPFDEKFSWSDGVYYNGGSWLREEIMAYAVGVRYGLDDYKNRILNRMDREINLIKDDPVSHEFLPTDLSKEGCLWKSIRVFSWNVFAITALEVAGIRKTKGCVNNEFC
ncbi:hypothetical protein K2F40_11900 [Clostridium sp. CM028]|uniref:hypothetical protein n=1 Tax=unclassified Clostridium TaxID=2614128 RepID=UPI001C0B54E1|nr:MULTISPECIES: hypothetical protein [unclassified Clostridium]MBU3092606.1 hypothetical protein [Clostridium sp. CF011]MBW9149665.1 hypothetical protein [Clostridium sp. CM028]WAG68734.1 hypothetical protein LL036_11570 [Clostridium sp. CF011]WLC60524.1 hypothetical protein KTC94_09945 [Clostridium sp. CM028]